MEGRTRSENYYTTFLQYFAFLKKRERTSIRYWHGGSIILVVSAACTLLLTKKWRICQLSNHLISYFFLMVIVVLQETNNNIENWWFGSILDCSLKYDLDFRVNACACEVLLWRTHSLAGRQESNAWIA